MPRIIIDRDERSSFIASSADVAYSDSANSDAVVRASEDRIKIHMNKNGGVVVDIPENSKFKVTVLED